jgi:hypothetical protein
MSHWEIRNIIINWLSNLKNRATEIWNFKTELTKIRLFTKKSTHNNNLREL